VLQIRFKLALSVLTLVVLLLATTADAGDCRQLGYDKRQLSNTHKMLQIGKHSGANTVVLKAAIIATLAETHARNKRPRDEYDSVGLFAITPGLWGTQEQLQTISFSARVFYSVAIPLSAKHPGYPAWKLAIKQERLLFPGHTEDTMMMPDAWFIA